MDLMKKYEDLLKSRKVLAIVDPPYGIAMDYLRDAKARLEKARYERESKKAEICVVDQLPLFNEVKAE